MLETLKALTRLTFSNPREAVSVLLKSRLEQTQLLQFATIIVALGVILSWIFARIEPGPANPMIDALTGNPVLFAVVQYALLMISVLAIFMVGRLFGGTGSFDQSLLVSIWLQFYMLLWQVALFAVALIVPVLAQSLNMAILFYLLWLMANFIASLHGFKSILKVFAGIIATSFAVSFLVVFLLAISGIGFKGI